MVLLRSFGRLVSLLVLASGCSVASSAGVGGAGGSGPSATSVVTGSAKASTSGGPSGTTSAATGTGQGGGFACASLPTGPITPTPTITAFDGSEDLAFDGKGHIAGKKGAKVVLIDANGIESPLADVTDNVFGLRYAKTGSLIAAVYSSGKLIEITPAGQVSDYASGFVVPNGVFPDDGGNVWVTETTGSRVSRVNPDKSVTTIVPSAPSANGVVLDTTRGLLFFTNYGAGKLLRVDPAGASMPVEVTSIMGAKLDGLVMDVCGNVYAMDQGNSRMYRVDLDASGDSIGDPKLLAHFPQNVANAQFGSGPGFHTDSLYVAGTPGTVYELPVGVSGASVVLPP